MITITNNTHVVGDTFSELNPSTNEDDLNDSITDENASLIVPKSHIPVFLLQVPGLHIKAILAVPDSPLS